jgi:hypothetical protein
MMVEEMLTLYADQNKPGEIWAIALSADGQYLASSSINGKINVWSLNEEEGMPRIREYETKGSFGLCVDLVCSVIISYTLRAKAVLTSLLEPQRQLHSLRPRKWLNIRLQQRNRPPRTLPIRPRPPRPQHSLLPRFQAPRSRRRRTHHRTLRRHVRRAGRKLHGPRWLGAESRLERYRRVPAVGLARLEGESLAC